MKKRLDDIIDFKIRKALRMYKQGRLTEKGCLMEIRELKRIKIKNKNKKSKDAFSKALSSFARLSI